MVCNWNGISANIILLIKTTGFPESLRNENALSTRVSQWNKLLFLLFLCRESKFAIRISAPPTDYPATAGCISPRSYKIAQHVMLVNIT
jgi:hypothetical protein